MINFYSNGSSHQSSGNNGKNEVDRTPFDEEEWDEEHIDPLVDNGEPGIKVRALYDYEAAEDDELDFKAGMTLILDCLAPFLLLLAAFVPER